MSKIQDVPFITKVIDTLSDELKSGLYDLIDGQVKTPVFRSLVNNDYAITEANDKGKVQFVTLETLRGNYTGYLAYNSVYCVLIAFKGNTQALDMLNINVAKHTFAFVNESLSILELRVELEDGKEGVTPTDLGVTNNNIHLAKGTKQIGEGVNLKTVGGKTIVGSGNVGFKTINDQEIVGDGNIVVGEGGTIAIDETPSTTSENALMNKTITNTFATKEAVTEIENEKQDTITSSTDLTVNSLTATTLKTDSYIHPKTIQPSEGTIAFNAAAIEGVNITVPFAKWRVSNGKLSIVTAVKLEVTSNDDVTLPLGQSFGSANIILPEKVGKMLVPISASTVDMKRTSTFGIKKDGTVAFFVNDVKYSFMKFSNTAFEMDIGCEWTNQVTLISGFNYLIRIESNYML